MRQIFKRLLMPIALVAATQISIVRADTIRVVGPNGQIQTSPTFSEPVQRAPQQEVANTEPQRTSQTTVQQTEPSRFYGPTRGDETLWSIATKLRPSNNVSVQQTLFAIYRLNPQAFENQNIHSLLPSSNLRVPSLAQVRSTSTEQAVAVMNSHLAKLNTPSAVRPSIAQPQPVQPKPAIARTPTTPAADSKTTPDARPAQKPMIPKLGEMNALEAQLEVSETELLALEEKNHQLRLMLSNVQSEVDVLKDELGDQDRIRIEVEKLLAEEREKKAEMQRMAPSQMDSLLSNGWIVAALAIIPGLLIGLIVVLLLGRKSNKDDEVEQTQPQAEPETADDMPPITLDGDMDGIDDDLSLDDELFGDDTDAEALFSDDSENAEDDVFAGLDDADLDFNLDGDDGEDPFAGIGDDGDLDAGFEDLDSANGISVNGDDKALGLEEMERALDETAADSSESGDGDFDLSDDSAMSADDIEALLSEDAPSEDLGADALDQSFLDDLLSETDDGDDEFDIDSLISEEQEPKSEDASTDDIDDIFAEVANNTEMSAEEDALDTDFDLSNESFDSGMASDDDIDSILSQFDEASDDEEVDYVDEAESSVAPESTDLLDELLEDESIDLAESTDLLEDVVDGASSVSDEEHEEFDPLAELEELSGLTSDDEIEIEEDSTATLDELLDGDESDSLELGDSSTDLLDELLLDESGDNDTDKLDISLDSDETLDELLGEELSADAEDSESLDPFDELLTEGIEDSGSFEAQLESAMEPNEIAESVEESTTLEEGVIDESLQESEPQHDSEAFDVDSDTQDAEAPDLVEEQLTEEETEFNSEDFIDDLFEVAPETDALLDDVQAAPENSETPEQEIQSSNEQSASDLGNAPLQPEFSPSEEHEETPVFEDAQVGELTEQNVEEPEEESVEDWLSEAIDDVESTPDFSADFDFTPEIEGSESIELDDSEVVEPVTDVQEELEEEAIAPEANNDTQQSSSTEEDKPAPVANEFGVPQDDDWLVDEGPKPTSDEEVISTDLAPETEPPAAPEASVEESSPAEEAPQAEDDFSIDDLELPEFNEEDALAEFDAQPEAVEEPLVSPELESETLDAEELAPETEAPEVMEAPVETASLAEDDFAIDDLELPEFNEEDALSSASEDIDLDSLEQDLPEDTGSINLDEAELPEYNEEDALADSSSSEFVEDSEEPIAEEADVEIPEDELPEYGEQEALSDAFSEPENSSEFSESEQSDQDALHDLFASSEDILDDPESEEFGNFDEAALAELLSEDVQDSIDSMFEQPLDNTSIDSAGLDIEAMLEVGGEDWNGFSLSPEQQSSVTHDVPAEEQEVWESAKQQAEPKLQDENWSHQENLTESTPKENQFMTIDELMAQVEDEGEELNLDDEALQLDVGLNEFPDVIGDIGEVDVDSNAEAAGKLDLAKIYIEMSDPQGAIKLLEEAIVDGSDEIRREAKNLIDTLNGR